MHTWAAARVAWPQSATSTAGVNQRRRNGASERSTNAVSEWRISAATAAIHASDIGRSKRQTPAGFPPKARVVKASTTYTGTPPEPGVAPVIRPDAARSRRSW